MRHTCLLILVLAEGVLCFLLTRELPVNILGFLERGIVWLFVPLFINVLVYCRNPYFKQMVSCFMRIMEIIAFKINKNR